MKKCGQHPIEEFEGWPPSDGEERDLVYFAVKKDHDMNFSYSHNRYSNEEKVAEAIIEEEERIVVIEDSQKEYIRNTRSAYYESMHRNELERTRTRAYPKIPNSEYEI